MRTYKPTWSKEEKARLVELVLTNPGKKSTRAIAMENHVPVRTLQWWVKAQVDRERSGRGDSVPLTEVGPKRRIQTSLEKDCGSVTIDASYETAAGPPRWLNVKKPEELVKTCGIDLDVWEINGIRVSSSEVTMRLRKYTDAGERVSDEPVTYTNVHVMVTLKRRELDVSQLRRLLDELELGKLKVPVVVRKKGRPVTRHLELDLLDPHYGMRCYKPGADADWSMKKCEGVMMEVLERLILQAEPFGPFEGVVWPFGNDFLHSDNVWTTTTGGTPQPESESWLFVYKEGVRLALTIAERLREVAPTLWIYTVPGNHDRQSVYTMGLLLEEVYRKEKGVVVDASASPYKFHRYGVNLIGFEHGHSIQQTARLAALMANERKKDWGETLYREWHLGDQHRKGSGRTTMMEEQGVSVEFLAGLTPPNEWHRIKSFNWQKRGATGFVWDREAGPIARVQVNLNGSTGELL